MQVRYQLRQRPVRRERTRRSSEPTRHRARVGGYGVMVKGADAAEITWAG